MIKGAKNKMIVESENKGVENSQEYFFPNYQVTVKASSQEEATAKAEKIVSEQAK